MPQNELDYLGLSPTVGFPTVKIPKFPKRTKRAEPIAPGAFQDVAFGTMGMAPEAALIDDEALLPTPVPTAAQLALPAGADQLATPTAPIRPPMTPEQLHEEALRTQQARPMPRTLFRKPVRAESPLKGITMPQLQGNVNLGDLMRFRLGMIGTGQQLIPRVAEAAQRRTQREEAAQEAQLGLKEVELGQRQAAGAAERALKLRGQETTLEAARIRAAGAGDKGMVGAMKQIEAGQQFEEMLPLSAPDLEGQTVAATGRQLADVYPPDAVIRVARQIQEQAAQAGEVDLSTAENAQVFNKRLVQTLNQMYPGRLPQRPQVAQ